MPCKKEIWLISNIHKQPVTNNILNSVFTIVLDLSGRPKSSLTRVPIFFSSSLWNISQHLINLQQKNKNKVKYIKFEAGTKEERTKQIQLPIWTEEKRSKEPTVNWRLVHNNRIFLVVARIASDCDNSILM